MPKDAILLLAHGTPAELGDIPEYLRNVTSGRPLPQAAVDEITHRYGLIGNSPLTELTMQQGNLLAARLGMPVYVGMRNWKPYIADVVRQMRHDGITRAVAICLAPQNSRTSVGLYRRAALAEASDLEIHFVDGWADHPSLADAFADRLKAVWKPLCEETGHKVPVLFTAHSVPCRTIQTAPTAGSEDRQPSARPPAPPNQVPDPYPVEAKHTAALVAERLPELEKWYFAFQSQGMSGGPWIGPTVEETLDAIHHEGHTEVVLQPIGFLCDHVEILYDVDIAFRDHAAKLGMRLERPVSLNDSKHLTEALADLAHRGLATFTE
jgi:ferrochelatase